jgi:hypothetical protein
MAKEPRRYTIRWSDGTCRSVSARNKDEAIETFVSEYGAPRGCPIEIRIQQPGRTWQRATT